MNVYESIHSDDIGPGCKWVSVTNKVFKRLGVPAFTCPDVEAVYQKETQRK